MNNNRCDDRCKKCVFQGRFGQMVCCDFYEITNIQRPKVEPCEMFEPANEYDFKKLKQEKIKLASKPSRNAEEVLEKGSVTLDLIEKANARYQERIKKGKRLNETRRK